MENKYQKSLKARLAGGVAAVGLAACCMAAPAFAANTANTDVTVQTDPATTQIAWEAPTVIAFSSDAAGTLTGPSASATKIVNKSVFPIHVTKVAAAQTSPFNLVSSVSTGTEANAIQFSMKTGSTNVDAKAGKDTSALTDYNMDYAGSSKDSISIEANNGKIARVSVDLTQAQKAATVTWTVAAGNAANQG